MKHTWRAFSLIVLYHMSFPLVANDDEARFIIGYVSHPRVIQFYKPFMESVYADIGINVEFVEVGGERGMRLLDEGMTDADVIRYDVVSTASNNIVAIEPPFAEGASFLLCIRNARCEKDVIYQPSTAIAVTTRFFSNVGKPKASITANIFEFDDFNHVLELLINGRFDYAILPSDFTQNSIFERQGIEYVPIVEHRLVHVINKKHTYLYSALSNAISNRLAISEVEHQKTPAKSGR